MDVKGEIPHVHYLFYCAVMKIFQHCSNYSWTLLSYLQPSTHDGRVVRIMSMSSIIKLCNTEHAAAEQF